MEQYRVRLSDGREFGPGSIELIRDWGRQGRIPGDALLVPVGSGGEAGTPRSVVTDPELAAIIGTPPTVPSTPMEVPVKQYSGVVPYRNPPALVAYYLGIFSCIPPIGLVAVILGFIGLQRRREDPRVKGSAHAWIGIVLGTLTTVIWLLVLVAILTA